MADPGFSQPPITCLDGGLPGVRIIRSRVLTDSRGMFVKGHHHAWFAAQGMAAVWQETFWTSSRAGVIRGMHFQSPPHDHDKLVACIAGRALDVLLDLRSGPGFGRSWSLLLEPGTGVYLPRGIAHGFAAQVDGTFLLYQVSSIHNPAHDRGVRWDSFGFAWDIESPILSDRDRALPPLAECRGIFP